ncbi:winged helix-turn-helix domain-containing protein [Amycolatopsis minnesotensis]|uniref:HTH arsR-type domain-containing protein n=1 Tax=Amycolatopsis minnesotensis TaxID=337894 RepID=A0ABN2RVL9_9PSEU
MRIQFTDQDLGGVRMTSTLGPFAETVFAMESFASDTAPALRTWAQYVAGQVDARATLTKPLALLAKRPQALRGLVGESAAPDTGLDRAETASAVQDFFQVALASYWWRVHGYLESVRDELGRALAVGGLERLFTTLHPTVRWTYPVLELVDLPGPDLRLTGTGLLLVPSVFLAPKSCVVTERRGQPALVFPAPPEPRLGGLLWGRRREGAGSLAALVGRTRAAMLQALTDSRTTGELAEYLGISPAGASHHTAVLRNARLITTHRHRNTVTHNLTALGVALLDGGANARPRRPAETASDGAAAPVWDGSRFAPAQRRPLGELCRG